MFPARGKSNSLSLRTSSMLVMGTCITLRVRAQDLRKDVVNLLSFKLTVADGDNIDIDLPSPKANAPQMIDVEMPENLEVGGMQVDFDLSGRIGRLEEITMREDFQLQIQQDTDDGFSRITYEEAMKGMQSLEGDWDCPPANENLQPNFTASAERELSPKRRTELDEEGNLNGATDAKCLMEAETYHQVGAGTMSPKRRTEVTNIQNPAEFEMDVPAPPVKAKNQPVPTAIEVTPAVENGERNQISKRPTSPVILDMDVDEDQQVVPRRAENDDNTRPKEAVTPMEEDLGLLPLSGSAPKLSKKRKRLKLLIDPIISISGEEFKEGLVPSAMTMESDQIRVDTVGLKNNLSSQTAGRNLGRVLRKEYEDAVRRCQLRKDTALQESVLEIAEGNNPIDVTEQMAEALRLETEENRRLSYETEQNRNVSIENDNPSIELTSTTTTTSERRSKNLDEGATAAEIVSVPVADLAILQEETEAQNTLPLRALSPVPGSENPPDVQLSPSRPVTNNMVNSQEAEEEINSIAAAENFKESPSIDETLNIFKEKVKDDKDQDDEGIRCHFSDICKGRSRRVVAKHFYNLLALEKMETVESRQEEVFKEIQVHVL